MKHCILIVIIAWLLTVTAFAQSAFPSAFSPLIVVEDRGGASALPYYEPLNPQADNVSRPSQPPSMHLDNLADAEAAMLPVRSMLLSSGEVRRRLIQAPGLTPVFMIGDDERSRLWLHQRQAVLRQLRAVGLVVNVETMAALTALRRMVPGITLSPVCGNDLAQRLGLRHYPVLITSNSIEQ